MLFPRTLTAVALLLAPLTVAQAQDVGYEAGQVVATVDGHEITIEEVEAAIGALGQQVRQMPRDMVVPIVANQLATGRLIEVEALESGLSEDEEVQARLEQARTSILQDVWLQRRLEEAVTEEALRSAYDDLVTDNPDYQQVRARHILVETEVAAQALIDQLDEGADFATLAEENSIGPSAERGGDLGFFAQGDMVEPFGSTAFDLEPGTYTENPIQTSFGWHVILVEESRYEAPSFEEVRDQLAGQVEQDLIGTLVEDLRAGAEITVYGPDGAPIDPASVVPQ